MTDNLGNFNSSTRGVAAVTASASGGTNNGVHGMTSSDDGSAVYGEHLANGIGVFGRGGQTMGEGVFGQTNSSASGVYGKNTSNGAGVVGESAGGIGVLGLGQLAGRFQGNVEVTGDLLLTGGDCAEEFPVSGGVPIDEGTVVVMSGDGAVQVSDQRYDTRVAGVVAGAGERHPGIILGRHEDGAHGYAPIALFGTVYCKVDATDVPIALGDPLTTSGTPGYAMKATEPQKAFGAVIGKAMKPIADSKGMIPVLVMLR
jgi:hypothetical protein